MPMHFDPTFRDDVWRNELWRQAMIHLSLPAPGDYGRIHIARETAQYVPLYGKQLMLSAPVQWTMAYEGATLWMSDTPQERLMMLQGTTGVHGHVLVAGGGLGLYPQYLHRYRRAERITLIERNPDIVTMLRTTLSPAVTIEIVHESFEQFITHCHGQQFDSCYIDIHPTLDPRWLPGLNWLRDRCAAHVTGPLRIWGYHWMARALVSGLRREYIPLLRSGRYFDDDLGRDLAHALPASWECWSAMRLWNWLVAYTHRIAWPLNMPGFCAKEIMCHA
jgi:hypothetical protein